MKKLKYVILTMLFCASMLIPVGVSAAVETQSAVSAAAQAKAAPKTEIRKVGSKYYGYVNGKRVKDTWVTWKGYKYYIMSKGYACTSCINLDGKAYVFNAKGQLVRPSKPTIYTRGQYSWYVDKNGQAKIGWFVVSNKLYYADPKGRLYKNRTRDGISFSATGAAKSGTASKLKIKTVQIMASITKPGMTKAQKLKAAWNYVVNSGKFYYRYTDINIWETGWVKKSAYEMLTMGNGSCTEFACLFAALAAEAGYNPYVVFGRVPGSRDGAADGMTRHCWVEINGLVYDPEGSWDGWSGYIYGSSGYPMYHTVTQYTNYIKSNPK